MLFEPYSINHLHLQNRLVRSATAEHMADEEGRPLPSLSSLYRRLATGGVGLIISGHMYVHPYGKAHREMTGVFDDDLLPGLAELAQAVHDEGGRIVAQINHGGMDCDQDCVAEPIAPSRLGPPLSTREARPMGVREILTLIEAFGQAARRVQRAGFDGVQIHAAHGYLIDQFLSPLTNHRQDEWGGDPRRRRTFLRAVCASIRDRVGPDFPLLIKLGLMDGLDGGLSAQEAREMVSELESMGVDGLEVSGGISGRERLSVREHIRSPADEAYFRPLAKLARSATSLPIALVGGMRSRAVMESVLASGDADLISMSRPLINDPEFPNLMRMELQEASDCISANECWPSGEGEGIACKCPVG
jgi:2,4-dienoyl-CoA reductase-like NADH-dependent reductase (Old Yellow Enzyme family)